MPCNGTDALGLLIAQERQNEDLEILGPLPAGPRPGVSGQDIADSRVGPDLQDPHRRPVLDDDAVLEIAPRQAGDLVTPRHGKFVRRDGEGVAVPVGHSDTGTDQKASKDQHGCDEERDDRGSRSAGERRDNAGNGQHAAAGHALVRAPPPGVPVARIDCVRSMGFVQMIRHAANIPVGQGGDVVTIHGDPAEVMKAAHGVLVEPYGYVDRVHTTIGGPCKLPFWAFGVAPSVVLSGAYETTRSSLENASKAGADMVESLAKGLGNVAHAMGGAEAANTLVPTGAKLQPTGISSSGSDRPGAQAGVIGTEMTLMPAWIATGAVTAACGALVPTALGAIVIWGLVEPNDAALSQAASGWQSAAHDVDSAMQYLDLALGPLDSGWPKDDTSRQAFDRWKIPFRQDMDDLKGATGKCGETLKAAAEHVQALQTDAFLTASISLGVLLALTALEFVPFLAAVVEPIKELLGGLVTAESAAIVGIIVAVLKTLYDAEKALLGDADRFNFSKPGDHTMPHFEKLKIDWDHEAAPSHKGN
jgi:uncharacterized protein YukE